MADKLTIRRVNAAKPGETIWDGSLPGFGLRVSKTGASKTYVLKYRRGAVQRWLTIGAHGAPRPAAGDDGDEGAARVWTPDAARREAQRLIGQVRENRDPARERQEAIKAGTVADLGERYLAKQSAPRKKPRSVAEDQRIFERYIKPSHLAALKARTVTDADISDLVEGMKATPYMANRVLALLSVMFSSARKLRIAAPAENPCKGVDRYPEPPRERYLTAPELRRLGRALRVVDRAGHCVYQVAAVRLLLFSGARLNEILQLKWEYIDAERRTARLPDSKTGAKTLSLNAPAIEVLSTLPRMADNPFVICGRKEGAHLVNLQKFWRRLRKAALISDVRLHDLRHSFASVGVSGGLSLTIIGGLLGHEHSATTQRYAHLAPDPKRAAAESIASVIDANLRGVGAEIVAFPKGAGKRTERP